MQVNRRTALGALGAMTLATTPARPGDFPPLPDPGLGPPEPLPIVPGPSPHQHRGVFGRMTGARAAVAALRCEGVPCVFGVPGAQNNEFWDAMKSAGQPYMLVTNESSSSVMADASARVTGIPGVFAVVPGPGLTNAMTGIGEAWLDNVPIVGLVTDIRRGPNMPVGQVHGLYNSAIMRPVTKAVLEVHHQGQIPGAIHHAFRLARSGSPGPVGVVIPYHLYVETWDYHEPVPLDLAPPWDESAYRRALRLLSDRRLRVGIYAGMGCNDAVPALIAVAELLQAPVATSVSGKGVIPDAHPLAVGWGYGSFGTRTAEKQFKDLDLVLAVGVRYSEVSTANYSIPDHPHLIHVDIDPNVLGRNVPANVKLCGDSKEFFQRLLADAEAIRRPPNPTLWEKIRFDRNADRSQYQQIQIDPKVDPMFFLTHLNRAIGPSGLMFVDVTASTHWASEAVAVAAPRRYFTPADNQSMGWSVPAAIGGQRVRPDLPVACVTGDGCFLMSGLEASTAVREHLPVKFFVLDDGVYHYMQMLQESTFRRTTATELARIDYSALARGLGLGFNNIGHNADVAGGIARAMAFPGPILTRVAISYEGRDIRWLGALKRSYIDKLSTDQKVRMASRLATRSVVPGKVND